MQDDPSQPSGASTMTGASARRRLVRGAFAAPVALTLQSGSAFAAASATCVARQVTNPVRTAATATDGTWLRVSVYKLTPQSGGGPTPVENSSLWVSGTEILTYAKRANNFIRDGQWYCTFRQSAATVIVGASEVAVNVGDILSVKPTSRGTGDSTSLPAEALPITPSQMIALRFNEHGDIIGIVGVGTNSNVGSAVTASCWSSFAPTTP